MVGADFTAVSHTFVMYAEHSINPSLHKYSLMNFGITSDMSPLHIVTHSAISKQQTCCTLNILNHVQQCVQFLSVLYSITATFKL